MNTQSFHSSNDHCLSRLASKFKKIIISTLCCVVICLGHSVSANTALVVSSTATDLGLAPISTSGSLNDIVFASGTSATSVLDTMTNGNGTSSSLNILGGSNGNAITVTGSGGSGTKNFDLTGTNANGSGSNSVAPNAADLLYIASNCSLTLSSLGNTGTTPQILPASGAMNIYCFQVGPAAAEYGATGNLDLASGATLTFQQSSMLRISGSANTVNVIGAGTINVGNIQITLGDAINFNGGTTIISGTTYGSGASLMTINYSVGASGTLVLNNNYAVSTGTLTLNGGKIDSTVSGITLSGSANEKWSGGFTFIGTNNLTTGTGAVTLSGGSQTVTITQNTLTIPSAIGDGGNVYGLTKLGSGTLALNGTNTYTGTTTVGNGTLKLAATGSISGTTLVLGVSGGTSGTLDVTSKASYTLFNLSGKGTVSGTTINVSTTLAPGFSGVNGTLNVTGNLTLSSTAAVTLKIGGLTSGLFDVVATSGTLTYGGNLNLTSLGGFNLAQVASYNLFTAGTFSGAANFASVTINGLTAIDTAGVWSVADSTDNYTFTQSSGILSVTAIPEPTTWVMMVGGLGMLVFGQRLRCRRLL